MTYPDGALPNHYFHDSLGDPATCSGAHNHPPQSVEDLPPEIVALARQQKCTRCKEVVVDAPSVGGTTMWNYYMPALGVRQRGLLCGLCGLLFKEFLFPELLTSPAYLEQAAALRGQS